MTETNPATGRIKVRGVIFDYGNVLSLPQPVSAVEEMAGICHIPVELFRQGYWQDRLAYDRGDVDATQYWKQHAHTAPVKLSAEQIARLVFVDSEGWSHLNAVCVDWVRLLHSAGLRLALLSNMPLELKNHLLGRQEWFSCFDHLVFSCDVHMVKPDSRIYQHCLKLLQLPPHEVLFLDDKPENVRGAMDLGIHGLIFDSTEATLARVKEKFDLSVPASLQLSTSGAAE
jgi:putative hydrolase of the HAD superfamily